MYKVTPVDEFRAVLYSLQALRCENNHIAVFPFSTPINTSNSQKPLYHLKSHNISLNLNDVADSHLWGGINCCFFHMCLFDSGI